ncbi:16S rRNA (cytidine(1402)-2'-O)-methyltransferase [Leuconostoc falkenbergense]|uniref:Ribosomal RNA small subunit methyltransferase I n=1 Tax=Leuconostoc falkenbergense TaxID=2766470 RepID=A0ABT7RY78_9LACO|nr:16S rRNA (cytidine(1402)-2'-O)-methyltransferase [Leuconostoc falkenbergense]MDM7646255.1 16S rRNA (cytidine(1402)-2'-O)-methyltransferase [Leuconostoc falkenbergense]MDY5163901.1 16S rRNA (cytidine(1402)-2'-O)-methyltransferase [Leuconostoc falkenbergense]HCU43531.1 16S rRNA (cytidine(1402)-2'-O)-methyltransferase [Leuconostoc pseudomesenteroides]
MQQQKSFGSQVYGTLYLVPTPIGNLGDISVRALDTLRDVDLIAAEDTRHTQQLLNHFGIETPQTSFHEHNCQAKIPNLIADLQNGTNVAQVSDAGMPSISDPGKELVAAAVASSIPVVPIPGATAGVTALIASGLVPQPFYFYGFLKRKNSEQLAELQQLSTMKDTIIFYEAPHRLKQTLVNIQKIMGSDRKLVLARELTKRYEEFLRGTASELVTWAQENDIRGEFVVMIDGFHGPIVAETTEITLSVKEAVDVLITKGLRPNAAIKQIAKERELDRQAVYADYHGIN